MFFVVKITRILLSGLGSTTRLSLQIGLSACYNVKVKVKMWSVDICYSATYMSQTRDQQRFTISEVAADWHEPMVPQRSDPQCS